jgi:hypothetical protein
MLHDGDILTNDNEHDEISETPDLDPALSGSSVKALADAIVSAVNDNRGPRKVTLEEYNRTTDAHRHKPALARKYYQNGIMLQREQLSADAINMLNALQPGLYCGGVLSVVPTQDGTKMSALDIRYTNKSVDDRMAIKDQFRDFEGMLKAMLKESGLIVAA